MSFQLSLIPVRAHRSAGKGKKRTSLFASKQSKKIIFDFRGEFSWISSEMKINEEFIFSRSIKVLIFVQWSDGIIIIVHCKCKNLSNCCTYIMTSRLSMTLFIDTLLVKYTILCIAGSNNTIHPYMVSGIVYTIRCTF